MKHLNLELEKLEERIAPWAVPSCGGGSEGSNGSGRSHGSGRSGGSKGSKGSNGSKGCGSK